MAEGDLTLPGPEPTPVADSAPPEAVPRRAAVPETPKRYTVRFGLAYALLAVVVGAAVGGFIVLVGTPGRASKPSWSIWKPSGSSSQRSNEIAQFVSRRYRLPTGSQLVGVLTGPSKIKAIAIQKGTASGGAGDYDIFRSDGTSVFVLCGLGKRCAIEQGPPTLERTRLLRREALELALYTFRYVSDVKSVVAFLPPKKGAKPQLALFFPKSDFKDVLDHPLRQVLPVARPPMPNDIGPLERVTIDRLTGSHLFRFALQQAQEGSDILVLAPVRL